VRAADQRLLRRLTSVRRSRLDRAMVLLSGAADRGQLWVGVAAFIALAAPRDGPRAASRGLISLAVASALANGPLKVLSRRPRPPERLPPAVARRLREPVTSSFPSGHSASAFAFAAGAILELPALAIPLGALAAAVAYSRVHTRLHYPSDVAAGAGLGIVTALGTRRLLDTPSRNLERKLDRGPAGRPSPGLPRAVLVISPRAGRAARGLQRAREAVRAGGIQVVQELPVDEVGRLPELLEQRGNEPLLVVAAGGDGTVGAVADVLARTTTVMGVIPLGTSNDFARSLRVPSDIRKAVALLKEGKVSTIDLGRIEIPGGRPLHFVHAATAGLNVSFAKLATQASFRKRLGRLAYAGAGAAAVRDHQPFRCRLVADGRGQHVRADLELTQLSVINAPVFGGFLGMRMRNSSVDDRLLDVLAVENVPLRRVVVAALFALLQARRALPGIHSFHVERMTAHSDRPLEVALDGEVRGRLPANFAVVGEALRVITPQDFEDVEDPEPPAGR
jgi:YegS/Rv2252/BmrU family lipid kinase